MKLRVLAYALAILAFFLFVGSPFQQAAQAVVGVSSALIAVIIAALAAMGITFITTGAYDSLEEYVGSLMNEHATSVGSTPYDLLRNAEVGSTKLGKLILNNRLLLYVETFALWLKAKFSMANNQVVEAQKRGYTLATMEVYISPVYMYRAANGETRLAYLELTSNPPVYWIYSNQRTIIAVTQNAGYVTYKIVDAVTNIQVQGGAINTSTSFQDYNTSPWRAGIATTSDYANIIGWPSGVTTYTPEEAAALLSQYEALDYNSIGINIKTGDIVLPTDDPDYNPGDSAILDVGGSWGETISDIVTETIPGEFSDGKEGEASLEYENSETAEEQVEDTLQDEISQEVSDYQVNGLASVFPFCIPFDMYAFVECLAADPVAPSFTWRFYVPGICDEMLVIDLSDFDQAAQILRTMELLLFCVGLAFITRKIIRG